MISYSGDVSNFTKFYKNLETFQNLQNSCKIGHIPTRRREKIDEQWSKFFENWGKHFFYVKNPHKPCEVIGNPPGLLTRWKLPTGLIFRA